MCTAVCEMPKYQCHKKVWALKIARIENIVPPQNCESDGSCMLIPEEPQFAGIKVSWEYMKKHMPVAGGYYVVYEGGYASFSPADAFEAGYSRI